MQLILQRICLSGIKGEEIKVLVHLFYLIAKERVTINIIQVKK